MNRHPLVWNLPTWLRPSAVLRSRNIFWIFAASMAVTLLCNPTLSQAKTSHAKTNIKAQAAPAAADELDDDFGDDDFGDDDFGDDGDIEEIEDVAPIAANAQDDAPQSLMQKTCDVVGKLHPAAVHLPIGWVFLAAILFAFVWKKSREDLLPIAQAMSVLATLSFIPAAITGFVRADVFSAEPDLWGPVVDHRNTILLAWFLSASATVWVLWSKRTPTQKICIGALLTMAAAAIVGLGGHQGGKLVFGDDYLPF